MHLAAHERLHAATGQLEIVLARLAHDPLFDFTEELQRWGAFTQPGNYATLL